MEKGKNNEAREKRIKFTHYLWALIKEPYVFVAVLFLIIEEINKIKHDI